MQLAYTNTDVELPVVWCVCMCVCLYVCCACRLNHLLPSTLSWKSFTWNIFQMHQIASVSFIRSKEKCFFFCSSFTVTQHTHHTHIHHTYTHNMTQLTFRQVYNWVPIFERWVSGCQKFNCVIARVKCKVRHTLTNSYCTHSDMKTCTSCAWEALVTRSPSKWERLVLGTLNVGRKRGDHFWCSRFFFFYKNQKRHSWQVKVRLKRLFVVIYSEK